MLADVICYCKMTSFIALDGVLNTCTYMPHSLTIGRNSSVQWRKLEEAEDFKYVFVIYCVLESKWISSSA